MILGMKLKTIEIALKITVIQNSKKEQNNKIKIESIYNQVETAKTGIQGCNTKKLPYSSLQIFSISVTRLFHGPFFLNFHFTNKRKYPSSQWGEDTDVPSLCIFFLLSCCFLTLILSCFPMPILVLNSSFKNTETNNNVGQYI